MTYDITDFEKIESLADDSPPPLCLVHYFAEQAAYPPERVPKPPGRLVGRVAERRGNLIVLEFAPPPEALRSRRHGRKWAGRAYDALCVALLLACLAACLAAFRF